jgi:hypothetical protein
LHGGRFEVPITQATPTAFHKYLYLIVLGNFADALSRFGINGHSAKGHLYGDILTIGTCASAFTTRLAIASKYVPLILKVDQGPQLLITLKVYMPASATVTAIGASLGLKFFAPKVRTSSPTLARATENLYIIYKIG